MSSASVRPLGPPANTPSLEPRLVPRPSAATEPLSAEARRLAAVVFAQMLPATLVAPAVRPLFALHHGAFEGGMHAFMSVNMVGAVAAALGLAIVPRLRAALLGRASTLLALDALCLTLVAAPLPLSLVLALRTVEGAAHVTMATLLFSHAAGRARELRDRRGLAAAGAAITLAVALGHLAGGALVTLDARAPFLVGALLLGLVVPRALARATLGGGALHEAADNTGAPLEASAPLWLAVAGAFVARFSVGCLVVTFALFVHKAHHLGDGSVGLLFATMTLPFALATYPGGVLAARGRRASVLVPACLAYAALLASLSRLPTRGLPLAMLGMGIASGLLFAALLSLATVGRAGAARTRAISLVNGAGCLGMLLGPVCAGITCAVLRAPDAPLRGYVASFGLGASAVVAFVLTGASWLAPRVLHELGSGERTGRGA